MALNKELLLNDGLSFNYYNKYEDSLNAHGLYNSENFVVRLSQLNHEHIDRITDENFDGKLSFEEVQAYSTYLHETIHWWQHIGSTIGLMISLSFPAQTHQAVEHLKNLLKIIGPKKSILAYNSKYATEYHPTTEDFHNINIVLNNFYDIEYFKSLLINPSSAESIVKSPLFESVGHSYNMGYAFSIITMAEVFDRNFNNFPNPDKWLKGFESLKNEKKEGYFYGSDIRLPPIGLREIYEGQARFCQMQYLYFGSGEELTWDDFDQLGFLDGVYIQAFKLFLEITDIKRPDNLGDPVVALFLLICDISINPGEGFPFGIKHYESFIISVDPGHRFYLLCYAVKSNPEVKVMITEYSKAEYEAVSKILCHEIVSYTPIEISREVVSWIGNSEELQGLLYEEEDFNFKNENFPIRVILSKYIRFCQDKISKPEFFCWPGPWMAGERTKNFDDQIFLKHLSLFMDKKNDTGIYPRQFPNVTPKNIHNTFNSFYAWNIMYDLTRQWIIKKGNFKYDYSWLTQKNKKGELKKWVDDIFEKIYGIRPDKFKILD